MLVPETGAGFVVRSREELGGMLIAVGSPTRIDEAECVAQNGSIRAVVGQRLGKMLEIGLTPKVNAPRIGGLPGAVGSFSGTVSISTTICRSKSAQTVT